MNWEIAWQTARLSEEDLLAKLLGDLLVVVLL